MRTTHMSMTCVISITLHWIVAEPSHHFFSVYSRKKCEILTPPFVVEDLCSVVWHVGYLFTTLWGNQWTHLFKFGRVVKLKLLSRWDLFRSLHPSPIPALPLSTCFLLSKLDRTGVVIRYDRQNVHVVLQSWITDTTCSIHTCVYREWGGMDAK